MTRSFKKARLHQDDADADENGNVNGNHVQFEGRAEEVRKLLQLVQSEILPFIASADSTDHDHPVKAKSSWSSSAGKLIIDGPLPPKKLTNVFNLDLPTAEGCGQQGLAEVLRKVLRYSVNTWNPGFMDKLYASTDPVGVASELVLAVLNTNVHVYQVSPALTIIEKETTQRFANLIGFTGPYAGGVTLPGGSASNSTSMIIAKNTLFPETKTKGNEGRRFVVFSSRHGHYSVEKAAVLCGFGSEAVWEVEVDERGRMDAEDLESSILRAKSTGHTPFYVNASAGTTVLGSYDPLPSISAICKKHNLWLHVDGSWGGSVAFSDNQRWRLKGVERVDSFTVNPHKMLGVPVTCSFLLMEDRRVFKRALGLKAGYLFHESDSGPEEEEEEVYDLAQMTMGCGRRADSLKMAFGWIYYGKDGYQKRIDQAFETASYFTNLLSKNSKFKLISENPPPCLQVCFYYIGDRTGTVVSTEGDGNCKRTTTTTKNQNKPTTKSIAHALISKGFMIDYSPSPSPPHQRQNGNDDDDDDDDEEEEEEEGEVEDEYFFRAVVNSRTQRETVAALVKAVEEVAEELASY